MREFCQLAKDGSNAKSKLSGLKLIEPKLDGVRVIAIISSSENVVLRSRSGKELTNFPHIIEQLKRVAHSFAEPMVLDGELISKSFQELMTQLHRKKDVSTADSMFHLFDIIPLEEFNSGASVLDQINRSEKLQKWWHSVSSVIPSIDLVPQTLLNLDTELGKEIFESLNRSFIDSGYEGLMVKDPYAKYETKRVSSWLKIKPVISVSLCVLSVQEGEGKYAGTLGALFCSGFDSGKLIEVSVGSGLTDNLRNEIWNNLNLVIGSIVEIEADSITKNQNNTYSLRFPRFVGFRGFEIGEKL